MISIVWGQQKSSESFSYTEIKSKIDDSTSDSIKKIHIGDFLFKAKKEKNLLKKSEAYNYLLGLHSHTTKGIQYADSIIQISKIINDNDLITDGHLKKGIQLFYTAENNLALKNYLIANDYAIKNNNLFLQLKIKHYIASLKNVVNEKEEALKMFKENLSFFDKKENRVTYKKQYLKSLFSLSNSYNRNKMSDSSQVYIELGLKESFNSEDKYLYPFFVLSYGVNKKLKGEYDVAIDSLLKGVSILKNQKKEMCDGYLLLSKTYALNNNKAESIKYLKKIDSVYNDNPRVISRARKANELLAKYYQETGEVINQLEKIKKILVIDSVLEKKHKNINKKIIKEYETPILLSKKERLIKQLNKNNIQSKKKVILMYALILVLISFCVLIVIRSRRNRKRYEAIRAKIAIEGSNKIDKVDLIKDVADVKSDVGLAKEVIEDILLSLGKFEKTNKFAKKHYTLNTLAKELNTNSTYLSKVINATKKMNFSNYLNNLKIDYAIDKLTNDKKIRVYTIKAIAEEVGFNNAQSFSVAFHKKTGIYPSYFIKKITSEG